MSEAHREQVARIIDPLGWGNIDVDRRNFPADPPDRHFGSAMVRDSLEKADAIIAILMPPDAPTT